MACAAGLACVNYYLKNDIESHVREVGQVLGQVLEEIKKKHACVGDVRYIGLFSSIELVKDKESREPLVPFGRDPEGKMKRIISDLKEMGFLTFGHENMILVAPPLIITADQIREEMDKVDKVLSRVDEEL